MTFMRGSDLRVIAASGGRSRLLVPKAGGCQRTVWSPDASTVAYTGPRGLILVDVRSRVIRRQAKSVGSVFDVTWSSDGSALYVVSRPPGVAGDCTNLSHLASDTLSGGIVVRGCP
jgi:WD40 repeat protein